MRWLERAFSISVMWMLGTGVLLLSSCSEAPTSLDEQRAALEKAGEFELPQDAKILNLYSDRGLDWSFFAKIQMPEAAVSDFIASSSFGSHLSSEARHLRDTDLPEEWWNPDTCTDFESAEVQVGWTFEKVLLCHDSDPAIVFVAVFGT